MKHSKSLHLPSYCDTQYTEWEFISDPFGNSYCNVLLNHSYILVSGLGYQACDIRPVPSSSHVSRGTTRGFLSQHRESLTPHPSDLHAWKFPPAGQHGEALRHLTSCPLFSCQATSWVSDTDSDMAGRCWAAFDAWSARSGFVLTAAQRAQQEPEVEDHTGPAGRHLHPEGRPAAVGESGLQHCWLVTGEKMAQIKKKHLRNVKYICMRTMSRTVTY